MAHDAFISYSSKNKPTADAACAALEAAGVRCWIAPRDIRPGADWGESIIDAIAGSRVMVLIFSSDANNSPQVRREVERAVNKGVVIVPFRIEDVRPCKSLEYFISVPHWMDACRGPMEEHLAKLSETVATLVRSRATEASAASAAAEVAAVVGGNSAQGFAGAPAGPGRFERMMRAEEASAGWASPRTRKWLGAGLKVGVLVGAIGFGIKVLGIRFVPAPRYAAGGTPRSRVASNVARAKPAAKSASPVERAAKVEFEAATPATGPTTPPVVGPAEQKVSAAAKPALEKQKQQALAEVRALKLTSIALVGRLRSCEMSGTMVLEGDTFRGFVVEKIHNDRVIVARNGSRYELRPQAKPSKGNRSSAQDFTPITLPPQQDAPPPPRGSPTIYGEGSGGGGFGGPPPGHDGGPPPPPPPGGGPPPRGGPGPRGPRR